MRRFWSLVVCSSLWACNANETARALTGARISLLDHLDAAEAAFDETQFRSVRKDARLVNAVTLNGRTERAITPPVPSTFRYRLRIPEAPVLRFATGAATTGDEVLDASLAFEIHVEPIGNGRSTRVFSDLIRRRAANQWRDHDVDLTPWAGQEVALVLSSTWKTERPVSQPVLASWSSPVLASADAARARPPLVLISIDCLRADHVGAYGYGSATTPEIDRVAADGVVFDKAFATASWTLPSHMSMLTGLLPSFHGATKWEKLSSSVGYLPETLAQAGYRTSGVVSWVYLSQTYGFERGYDSYRVLEDPEASDIVDAAIEELHRGEGQPQFLFVHVYDPHWPYLPPPDLIEKFGPRPRDISDILHKTGTKGPPKDDAEIEEVKRLYDSEVAFADRELGRLFDKLRTSGMYDDALIIITADHGEAFYEHGHWQHSQTLYDELTHVPMIVKLPNSEKRGRSRELASQMDIFVTLLEAAGVDAGEPQDGFLERRSLSSESTGANEPRTLLSEVTWRSPSGTYMKVSFRDEKMKYVATLSGPVGDDLGVNEVSNEELYELSSDPDEMTNLLPAEDARAQPFRAELRQFLDAARAARSLRGGEAVELDDETRRKLESLGYTH
jgi:arylsulfatase A-like enzyme